MVSNATSYCKPLRHELGNIHNKTSDSEAPQTTWPTTADAVTTAQQNIADTHTGNTCETSQQHDVEQLAHEMKQHIVDDSVQLEPLPQDPCWPEPTTMTEQIIPDVAATTYDIPSPTHTPTTDKQANWTVVLRAFSNKLAADYLDAKPPTPTHDGQAGGKEIYPPSLSKLLRWSGGNTNTVTAHQAQRRQHV